MRRVPPNSLDNLTLLALVRRQRLRVASATLWVAAGLALTACAVAEDGEVPELEPNEDTRYELQDRLGSASVVLAQSGEVVTETAMEPYGETWAEDRQAGESGPVYRFTDKELDVGVGTIYIGMRHYAPQLGRWTSPDPKFSWEEPESAVVDPREGNAYRYAANSPVDQVDPDGRDAKTKFLDVNVNIGKWSYNKRFGLAIDPKGRTALYTADTNGTEIAKNATGLKKLAKSAPRVKTGSGLQKNDRGIDDLTGTSTDKTLGAGPFEMTVSESQSGIEVTSAVNPAGKGPSASLTRTNTQARQLTGESTLGKLLYWNTGTTNPLTATNNRVTGEVLYKDRGRTNSRIQRAALRAVEAAQ